MSVAAAALTHENALLTIVASSCPNDDKRAEAMVATARRALLATGTIRIEEPPCARDATPSAESEAS